MLVLEMLRFRYFALYKLLWLIPDNLWQSLIVSDSHRLLLHSENKPVDTLQLHCLAASRWKTMKPYDIWHEHKIQILAKVYIVAMSKNEINYQSLIHKVHWKSLNPFEEVRRFQIECAATISNNKSVVHMVCVHRLFAGVQAGVVFVILFYGVQAGVVFVILWYGVQAGVVYICYTTVSTFTDHRVI